MPLADLLGGLGAGLTTASFVPQALKVVRTRETGAISLTMYSLFTAGVMCWAFYGVLTLQWSIIIANAITFVLACVILGIKVLSLIKPSRPH